MKKYEEVGTVAVDSGMLWIGDPCYVKDKLGNWKSVYTKVEKEQYRGVTKFQHENGHEGLGVCVGGFGGDGEYSVEVVRSVTGLIIEVRIVFSRDK